jgi:hypothetical protein
MEQRWMKWLGGLANWKSALCDFVTHYHYFSVNQVIAFSRLFGCLPRTDRDSLAMLAEVLFEELGNGKL